MLQFVGKGWWTWLVVSAVLGAILGVVSSSWSSGYVRRELEDEWRPNLGVFSGIVLSILVGLIARTPLLVFFIAAMIAYLISRFPKIGPEKKAESEKSTGEGPPDRMQFRKEWNARPRFESEEEGLFVGREDFLNRLTSHFISKGGGTILISGVRGVGKTALVDRALVDARQKLQSRYWKKTFANHFKQAPRWHFIERKVEQALLELRELAFLPNDQEDDYRALQRGLDKYVKRPTRRFWQRLHPVERRLRRMHEASRNQLFVLKFSASDISGSLAEPDQKSTENPRIDPERLLRAVIRKLFMTCHPSRQENEAKILQWSLNKRVRQLFVLTLESAYNKSISKSYKEIVTNSLNDFLKKSQSSVYEGKMSLERVVLLIFCLALCVGAALAGWTRAWHPLQSYIASGLGALVAAYFTLSWTFKRSRESGSERTRQSQFSYEYDYSLDQMQRDVESLVRILHPAESSESGPDKFDPYRCFRRSAVIFDEMDKLDDPDKQLDNVITHFKNFFTLSEAEFVFLTDHRFYEHLVKETVKAQLEQHYPPQHTFFTEKLYLRKPEFGRFREAFYRFAHDDWISKRANTLPADPVLTKYLLRKDEKPPPKDETWMAVIKASPLETLTQLFIQREQYGEKQKTLIESEFKEKHGWDNAVSVAQIWASQVSSATTQSDFPETRKAFTDADGWDDPEAVALLYYYRSDFGKDDEALIKKHYQYLDSPSVTKYTTVDETPFTLSDLARALCFQTRNHYFDLYNSVYDYVQSYDDGAPVLPLDDGRFAHEPRLWSRYQQLLEIAFDSAKEDHPSREYFNTLLMESLYNVFDTRGSGENISVSDVLFAANGLMPPPLSPDPIPQPEKVEDPGVSAFTGRDKEKINQAIIRLLRLALAHDAISSAQLKTSLTNEKVKPEAIANLKFSWNDNSLSIIRGDDAEQHEQALIEFWDKFKFEFEPLDAELTQLWLNAPISGEGARMQHFIEELRTKAEGLRLKSGKVSRPDALALKANLGSTSSRNELLPRNFLERIRAEDDAEILEDVEKPKTQVGSILEDRKKAFESATRLRLRAMICPRDTDCFIYLVASAIPANFDSKSLVLEGDNTYVFWYVPASDTATPTPSDKIYFCFPPWKKPSLAKLFADYVRLASLARLRQIISRWLASKDRTFALAAGAELIGPITSNSELQEVLARPTVAQAIAALTQAGDRFISSKFEAWKSYGIEHMTDRSASEATIALAETLANLIDATGHPLDFKKLIEGVLSNAVPGDTSSWTVDSWTRSFISTSSDPSNLGRLLLIEIIRFLVMAKLRTADIKDPKFDSAARSELAPWLREFASLLAQQIVELAKSRGGDLRTILSTPDLPVELEKYRRTLKPIFATNATPTTPSSKPNSPGRLRRSKKLK